MTYLKKSNLLLSIGLFGLLSSCNVEDLKFDNLYVHNKTSSYAVELGFASYTMVDLLQNLDDESLIIDSTSSDVVQIKFKLDSFSVTKGDLFEDTDILEVEAVEDQNS